MSWTRLYFNKLQLGHRFTTGLRLVLLISATWRVPLDAAFNFNSPVPNKIWDICPACQLKTEISADYRDGKGIFKIVYWQNDEKQTYILMKTNLAMMNKHF